MKKTMTVLLLICMMCMLAACGNNATESSTNTKSQTATTDATKVLVVNFSCTGNTKLIAETTAELLQADFYEIVPAVPYTEDDLNYNVNDCRANREQENDSARPEIASEEIDLAKYGTILISFPIWWGKEPRIIDTFMEKYDFSGKNMAIFCTSGSSDIKSAESNIKAYVPDATWLGANRFEAGASEETIQAWLSSIGLK